MSLARKNSASHPDEMTVSEPENLEEGEGSHVQRSFGSIKRSVRKVPSEGLIVLSPEPGQVKFESADISKPGSSTDSTSVVRNGSAGHVERSLKLARKKEQLESEIPRRNSTGAEIIDDPIISRLGELKLGKQEDIMKSCPTTDKEDSDSEFSSESDKGSINDGEHCGATDHSNKAEASVELKGEFLKAVMDEDYEKAKELCHKLLLLEPDNKICSEFHAVIVEKMQQDAADEDEESGDDDDDSSSTESSESGEEDEGQESDDKNSEDDDDSDNESDSDDDYTPLSGPINLIVGGLPIRPQSR
ncbi:uncharacterized protein LOC144661470 isoform X2 [Oculina patagonica]